MTITNLAHEFAIEILAAAFIAVVGYLGYQFFTQGRLAVALRPGTEDDGDPSNRISLEMFNIGRRAISGLRLRVTPGTEFPFKERANGRESLLQEPYEFGETIPSVLFPEQSVSVGCGFWQDLPKGWEEMMVSFDIEYRRNWPFGVKSKTYEFQMAALNFQKHVGFVRHGINDLTKVVKKGIKDLVRVTEALNRHIEDPIYRHILRSRPPHLEIGPTSDQLLDVSASVIQISYGPKESSIRNNLEKLPGFRGHAEFVHVRPAAEEGFSVALRPCEQVRKAVGHLFGLNGGDTLVVKMLWFWSAGEHKIGRIAVEEVDGRGDDEWVIRGRILKDDEPDSTLDSPSRLKFGF